MAVGTAEDNSLPIDEEETIFYLDFSESDSSGNYLSSVYEAEDHVIEIRAFRRPLVGVLNWKFEVNESVCGGFGLSCDFGLGAI